jgi:hypothetical protein
VYYVDIDRFWIEDHVAIDDGEERAWSANPVNAQEFLPATRHILIRAAGDAPAGVDAQARARASAALARVRNGEDFAKVAREVSEDPGSKDKGGLYDGSLVRNFVFGYRTAYAKLLPGTFTQGLVRTDFGYHVIKKEAADAAAKRAGFKSVKSREVAEEIQRKIAEALRRGEDRKTVVLSIVPRFVVRVPEAELPPFHAMNPRDDRPPGSPCESLGRLFDADVGAVNTHSIRGGDAEDDGVPQDDGFCGKRVLTPERIRQLLEQQQREAQP